MKTSIFTLIYRDKTLEETLKLSKEIGFDAVELWGTEPHISANTSIEKAISEESYHYDVTHF